MSEFNVELAGGSSVRLPTAGKYCDRDIVVTAADGKKLVRSIIERAVSEFKDEEITTIGKYAFSECEALTVVDAPLATDIGEYAFYNCKSLTEVNAPTVTSIGIQAFYTASQITDINFPLVNSIGVNAFTNCEKLSGVSLPLLTAVNNGAFGSCINLKALDLPLVSNIGATAFYNCTNLTKLILRNSELCALTNVNAVSKTPFAEDGTGGRVFVPRDLIEAYQTATNWATLYAAGTCEFLAIEDYTVDGTITGALDWDKINAEE